MRHKNLFLFVLFVYISNISCKKECYDSKNINLKCWNLTFSQEFNEDSLDFNIWTSNFSYGQTSYLDHQQLYIDSAFELREGKLFIVCKKEKVTGVVYDESYNPVLKTYEYSSGLLTTENSFSQLYGLFEIRCRFPYGKGFWPAFWLLPYDKWPPEIDILEHKGNEPNRIHFAQHFNDKNGNKSQYSRTIEGMNFTSDFHTFSLKWSVTELIWYVDGKEYFRSDKFIPHERMWIVVNLALGGGFSGYADHSTPSPAYFEIDYIRAYQLDQ